MKKNKSTRWLWSMMAGIMCWISLVTTIPVYADGDEFSQDSIPVQVTEESLNISAKAYVLMDGDSGKILHGNKEHERLPMASTTKIMTALIALEQENIDEYFTVDAQAIRVEGSSMGLMEGDQVSLRMLAYGMLLPSGNDAANATAVKIAGSIKNFENVMNEKAAQIGMENSHFVTPSGLHDDNHYTTAYDMALLAKAALQNQDFAQICSTKRAQLKFGNPPFDRWLSNHNRLLKYYEDAIGIKTGFTKKAGRCLVSAAKRETGGNFICVTLNASNDWNDHTKLLDYGFSKLQPVHLKANFASFDIPVVGSVTQSVGVEAVGTPQIQTTSTEEEFEQKIIIDPFVYAPIKAGDPVGELQFMLGNQVVESVSLVAKQTVYLNPIVVEEKLSVWDKMKRMTGLSASMYKKWHVPPLR